MNAGYWKSGDFNGDRCTDYIHIAGIDYVNVWTNQNGVNYKVTYFQPWPGYYMQTGSNTWEAGALDFNFDGRTDVRHYAAPTYGWNWRSNGNATFSLTQFAR